MAVILDIPLSDVPPQALPGIEAALDAEGTKSSPYEVESYLRAKWKIAKDARIASGVEDQMLANLRQIAGEYDQAKLAALEKAGMCTTFFGLTGVKFRAALAWCLDIFTHEEDKTWGIRPSPSPALDPMTMQRLAMETVQRALATIQEQAGRDEQGQPVQLPPEQVQAMLQQAAPAIVEETENAVLVEAGKRAEKAERMIHDQLVEGGWEKAFGLFLMDMIGNKAGIMKGPIVVNRKRKTWDMTDQGPKLSYGEKKTLIFERVSPFDAYPAPDACDFTSDFSERQRFTRNAVFALKGLAGYDQEKINDILDNFDQLCGNKLDEPVDLERDALEEKITNTPAEKSVVEGVEHWYNIPGDKLIDYGLLTDAEGAELDPQRGYDTVSLFIADRLVSVQINPDPLGEKPYSKNGWAPIQDSFWYQGLPEVMADVQAVCNACARSIVNNMGLASGFQVIYNDVSRVAPGEDITNIYAHKIHQFTNKMNSQMRPIEFTQPTSNAAELMGVLTTFMAFADDATGLPPYTYGNDKVAGAGRTATGLSMLMGSSARGIKRVIVSVDRLVIKPIIERTYNHLLLFSNNPNILGDAEVVATGAVAIMTKEVQGARRMDFLRETNNPIDNQIMGTKGRALLLREVSKSMELDGQAVVPDNKEIERKAGQMDGAQQQQQQAETQAAQMEAQARQAEVELKKAEAQLKVQEFELKKAELDLKREEIQGKLQLEQLKIRQQGAIAERNAEMQDRQGQAKVQLEGAKILDAERVNAAKAASEDIKAQGEAFKASTAIRDDAKKEEEELNAALEGASERGAEAGQES